MSISSKDGDATERLFSNPSSKVMAKGIGASAVAVAALGHDVVHGHRRAVRLQVAQEIGEIIPRQVLARVVAHRRFHAVLHAVQRKIVTVSGRDGRCSSCDAPRVSELGHAERNNPRA